MKDLGLSADLLKSVAGVMRDSSAKQAEQSKDVSEKLSAQYVNRMGVARPRTAEEARVATLEGRAPQRRISDAISQVYSKSTEEHNARAKEEAAAIERAYAKMGASKPISESVDEACSSKMKAAKKEFKKAEEEKMKSRTVKARDAIDEDSEQISEKEYVMPYNSKKTASAGDRYKSVVAHAKKMGYKVHHQDTAGDEKGDADITVHYQGGESRHSSDPESIEIHKGGKAHGDKALHAFAKGTAAAIKEETAKKTKEPLPFTPDKPKKNPSATAGKYGQGYSTARHLARQGIKDVTKGMTKEEVTLSAEEIARIEELAKQFEEQ